MDHLGIVGRVDDVGGGGDGGGGQHDHVQSQLQLV